MALIPILSSLTNEERVAGAVGFAAGYGFLESYILQNYLDSLNDGKPVTSTGLYKYHLFGMLPAFITASGIIGFDDRMLVPGYNPINDPDPVLRTFANTVETFVPLVIMEDMFYFILRGFDKRRPDTYMTFRIKKEDWTCKHLGCTDMKISEMPNWYAAGAAVAGGVWLLNNVVFPRGQ